MYRQPVTAGTRLVAFAAMPRGKKNSLVNNINKRKKAGTSRSKSRSTVSKKSYRDMQRGWPKSKRKRKKR